MADENLEDDSWWLSLNSLSTESLNREIARLNDVLSDKTSQSNTQNGIVCEKCGAKFSKKSALKYHQKNSVCENKKTRHICEHCGKVFKRKEYFTAHVEIRRCNRGVVGSNKRGNPPKTEKPSSKLKRHTFERCLESFSCKFGLKRHMQSNNCTSKTITQVYTCNECAKMFDSETTLRKHMITHNQIPSTSKSSSECNDGSSTTARRYECQRCNATFLRRYGLQRHTLRKVFLKNTSDNVFTCNKCSKTFASVATLKNHVATHKQGQSISNATGSGCKLPASSPDQSIGQGAENGDADADDTSEIEDNGVDDEVVDIMADGFGTQRRNASFENTLIMYRLPARQAEICDIMYFFSNRRAQLRTNIDRDMEHLRAVKWYVAIKVEMDRRDTAGIVFDTANQVFRSSTVTVMDENVIDDQINEAYLKILRSFDAFKSTGSGWALKRVIQLEYTITKYNPLRGNCFQYAIPAYLLRKPCLLNVTGPPALNGQCFRYAVLAALYTDPGHVDNVPWSDFHPQRNTLSFEGMDGTGKHMPITEIPKFEALNNVSINVYGYEDDVFPVYVTETYQENKHVNLLLLPEVEEIEDEVQNFETIADRRSPHYCVVKDMGRLLRGQADPNHPIHVCMRCLAIKPSIESLNVHKRLCSINEEHIRYVMPTDKQKWLKFRNFGRKMKLSFVIYATFGWITSPIYTNDEPVVGFKIRERQIECCAYSYHRVSIDDTHQTQVHYYRGTSPEDTMCHFLEAMKAEEEDMFRILGQPVPVIIDDEGLRNTHNSNDTCFVCKSPFLDGERIALDHSHVSGRIRGRVHADSSNLRLKEQNYIPIVMQNLSHFDGRLLLQAIGKFGPSAVKVIPQTLDTYVSITINKCRYLDFIRFLKVPLQDLVDSVKEKSGLAEFRCVKQHVLDEQLDVAVQSQVFCHDYLDSSQRFTETELPPIEDYFDRIADKDITIDQYSQVQRIWDV